MQLLQATKNISSKYRPEIDGLRALAVLSVIIFHFDIALFSGGFIGVDIFFVISGFLITQLILDDIGLNRFNLKQFYLRRARRLFPTFFATLLATFITAAILFSPEDLQKLSGSLVYALLSASNIFFWQQTGYFDSAATLKPLLHTWSLSVEEQFYLIWPGILILSSRFVKATVPITVLVCGLISLALSEYAINQSPATAFYWMPLRIFEFSMGGLLYWSRSYQRSDHIFSEVLALAGLCLIAYSIYTFNDASRFPGVLALLPCVGAACLIQAGPTRVLGRLLGSRPMVSVGLISYSLYLVHWPLVVFTKYVYGPKLNVLQQGWLLVGSFAAACLLYITIEKPLRYPAQNKSEQSSTGFALCCSLLALAMVLPAADAWANKGWIWRFSNVNTTFLTRYDINNKDYVWAFWRKVEAQPSEKSKIYIIGDSQAADMLNSIEQAKLLRTPDISPRVRHVQFSCGAVVVAPQELDIFYEKENILFRETKTQREVCENQRASAFSDRALKASGVIILSPFWQPYLVTHLSQTLDFIRERSQAQIIVVGHKHMLASSTSIFNNHKSLLGIEVAAAEFINPETIKINANLEKITKEKGVLFFNPLNALCDSSRTCHVVGEQGGPVTFDTHHLTPEGAVLMGKYFKNWLAQNTSLVSL